MLLKQSRRLYDESKKSMWFDHSAQRGIVLSDSLCRWLPLFLKHHFFSLHELAGMLIPIHSTPKCYRRGLASSALGTYKRVRILEVETVWLESHQMEDWIVLRDSKQRDGWQVAVMNVSPPPVSQIQCENGEKRIILKAEKLSFLTKRAIQKIGNRHSMKAEKFR